jgi:hypothetical protein
MAETQEHGALFFFATDEPPTVAAIDDDIYLTVTTAVPDLQTRSRRSISSYRSNTPRRSSPALDRRHYVAPLQGVLIGFTPLRPPSQP